MPAEREDHAAKDVRDAADAGRLRARLAEAERLRQQLETRLRMLETAVETMSTGVTISDMEGRIIYVNPADARMHGYAVDELVGQEASRYAALSAADAAIAPEEPWIRERIDTTKDGRSFPVRLISGRLRAGEGEFATVTICEDLRERKRIQEALARQNLILEALGLAARRFLGGAPWEQKVEEVLEKLGRATGVDLIYIALLEDFEPFAPKRLFLSWDTQGGSEEKAFSESLGLPERIDLFARWEDRLRQGKTLHGSIDELPAEQRQILESCGVRSFVVVPIFVESTLRGYLSLEDGDPERDWLPAELEALRTAASTFAASIQKREAEKALEASEEKYRDLLENANDLIQSVAPDGHFHYVNRAWRETLGYSAEEVERLRLWEVVRPDSPASERDIQQVILGGFGEDGNIEAVFVTKEGREITVEGSINCRYVDGLPVSTRGVFRDISERKRAERLLHEFVSTVSHELRTPLTSIIASLGLLDSGRLEDRPDRRRELVTVAHRNSQRLLRLINNLLDLQKISAGKMTFKIRPLEAHPLIAEALEDIRAFADSQQIALRLREPAEAVWVLADRERLLQVLDNLLSNAIKFSPDRARVEVAVELRGDKVRLLVADQGPGIPEGLRKRVFERFSQVDSGGRRRVGGSGLGLSIVKGLVEGMNGSVDLITEVQQGTSFYVDLPAAGSEDPSPGGPGSAG
jgi:PAS domain S-box-containing protein